MGAAIIDLTVMVNMQFQNFTPLIDGFKIQPEAENLFFLIKGEPEKCFAIIYLFGNIGVGYWECSCSKFLKPFNIGLNFCCFEQIKCLRVSDNSFPNPRALITCT